ncbi:MAG: hypothetical protein IIA58_01645 [Candidatus Marinimicrobia bacterium]|nr:hypothetical protein [Candidatus Neomarinimicrobiota bacterium]
MSKLHTFKFLWDIRRLALVGLAVFGLLLVGCDQETEVTSVPQEETLLESVLASQIQAVMAIQDRHTDRLLAISGAVGTATGLTEDGKPAILVFIKTEALAKGARIPASIEDVPVIVEVTGMFIALTDTDPKARQPRPVPIGVSTGHPDITAGTIGARVTDGTDVFALSNNHVYANINEANLGDSALQPGPFDGGEDPADKIGELSAFEPILFDDGSDNIINFIDAAIAISSTDLLGNSTPHEGYGTPNSAIVSAALKQAVQKYGRTTGLTTGEVVGVNATVVVCYKSRGPFFCNPNFIATFVDQIVITPGGFSSGGDSGSLIVTNDESKNPVGLLFAGSSTHTIANRIDLVLGKFGVTIDDSEPAADTTPPALFSATVDNSSLVLVYDEQLDPNSVPVSGDFSIGTNGGDAQSVTAAGVSGTDVTLTLSPGVASGDAVTVSYSAGDNPIQDTAGNDAANLVDESVTNNTAAPAEGVNVTNIVPNTMGIGTTIDVTINGSGFAAGAEVTFENGTGPAPTTSDVAVGDANTITGTVTAKSGGPSRNRVWDVRVTNPDGSSGVLLEGFTVIP